VEVHRQRGDRHAVQRARGRARHHGVARDEPPDGGVVVPGRIRVILKCLLSQGIGVIISYTIG
jgi:hypothetical protein